MAPPPTPRALRTSNYVPSPRDSCPCSGIRTNHLRIRGNATGSVSTASGSMPIALGFVPIASGSALMPRDPCMLHRDSRQRLEIRARYSTFGRSSARSGMLQ